MFLFTVNDDHFAFDLDDVKEVAEPREPVTVPVSVDYLKGAINYKGSLYCIIDTGSFFSAGALDIKECSLIILSHEEYKVGFLAGSITGAVDVKEIVREKDDGLIKAYFDREGHRVNLINCEKVLEYIEKEIDDTNFR